MLISHPADSISANSPVLGALMLVRVFLAHTGDRLLWKPLTLIMFPEINIDAPITSSLAHRFCNLSSSSHRGTHVHKSALFSWILQLKMSVVALFPPTLPSWFSIWVTGIFEFFSFPCPHQHCKQLLRPVDLSKTTFYCHASAWKSII